MKLRLAKLLTLIVAAAVPALGVLPTTAFSERSAVAPTLAAPGEDPSGARVIVKFKALGRLMRGAGAAGPLGKGPQHAATLGGRHGLSLTDGYAIEARTQVVHGDKSLSSAALAAKLAADPDVEYAVPDVRRRALALPNDPLFAAGQPANPGPAVGQWYLRAPDATFISAINAAGAWNVTTGSASVVVADVDTGVLFSHPDLTSKLYPGRSFVSTGAPGTGWSADATDPGDWTTAGQCGSGQAAEPSSWHGTQTASLIGADTNNGVGMASVGYNVFVLPVRALGKCGGTDSDIAAAMLWAGGIAVPGVPANLHPAKVINLSLGGSGSCADSVYPSVISQLTAAGVVVVAAAGNDEGLAVGVPANCPGVIAVAGVRHTGTKVGYSNIGPQVALSAPAGNCVNTSGPCLYPILTATNTGTTTAVVNTYSDSSNASLGTSFSTPLVAGTAALMLSINPSLSPAQVRTALQTSARAFPTTSTDPTVLQCQAPSAALQNECLCTTSTCGAGLLDAAAAVAAAGAGAQPTASVSASATTVVLGTSVSFDGSASTAPSGRTIASYQWTLTSGSAIAAFSGATNAATASVATSGVGSFTVKLTVTDSAGQQASNTSTVTVNPPAAPTVKVLASGNVVTAGSDVTFDGSGSSAASGLSITAYQWTITSGAALATFTSTTNAATATLATAGTASGSFTVRLTVTDSLGQQSSATSTVSVTPLGPTASISASAVNVTAGNSVSFDGGGSSATSGRAITAYLWTMASGTTQSAFVGATNGPTATVTTGAAGTLKVQLTVTDSAGAQDAKIATVTVDGGASSGGSGSGSGGGGATGLGWLFMLALSVGLVFRARSREHRQR
jgi:serine protease